MDWTGWIEQYGEPRVLLVCGLLTGLGSAFSRSAPGSACAPR
jgi:hypothetical protein